MRLEQRKNFPESLPSRHLLALSYSGLTEGDPGPNHEISLLPAALKSGLKKELGVWPIFESYSEEVSDFRFKSAFVSFLFFLVPMQKTNNPDLGMRYHIVEPLAVIRDTVACKRVKDGRALQAFLKTLV